jgi:hypothetical protein
LYWTNRRLRVRCAFSDRCITLGVAFVLLNELQVFMRLNLYNAHAYAALTLAKPMLSGPGFASCSLDEKDFPCTIPLHSWNSS